MKTELIDADGYEIQITPRILQGYDCHVMDNTGSCLVWTVGANTRKKAISDTLEQVRTIQERLEAVADKLLAMKEEARDE